MDPPCQPSSSRGSEWEAHLSISMHACHPPSHCCPVLSVVSPAASGLQPFGAFGQGPVLWCRPQWGPAPHPGRMWPGESQELSRTPVPTLCSSGLQSHHWYLAPKRHDFKTIFRSPYSVLDDKDFNLRQQKLEQQCSLLEHKQKKQVRL